MLKEELKALSNQALRDKDSRKRKALTGILARFLEIEKSGTFEAWTPELEQDTVRSYIKSLKKALEPMRDGQLKEDYLYEIEMLSVYLPKELSEEETRALVEPYAAKAKGLGPFIGMVMKAHRGQVNPQIVRKIGMELGLS